METFKLIWFSFFCSVPCSLELNVKVVWRLWNLHICADVQERWARWIWAEHRRRFRCNCLRPEEVRHRLRTPDRKRAAGGVRMRIRWPSWPSTAAIIPSTARAACATECWKSSAAIRPWSFKLVPTLLFCSHSFHVALGCLSFFPSWRFGPRSSDSDSFDLNRRIKMAVLELKSIVYFLRCFLSSFLLI